MGVHPGIADVQGADQFVQRHLVGHGDRKQQFQAGAPLAGHQSGQRALGDASGLGQRGKGHVALGPEVFEARPDRGQGAGDRR